MQVAPLLLPHGQALDLSLEFDPNCQEALELRQRLAASPMTSELIEKLAHTHVRDIYRKQVNLQQLKILNKQPQMVNEPEQLELEARHQAMLDLKLDTRQLQNKFLLTIPAIHKHLLNKRGQQHIDHMVNEYNMCNT